GELRRASRDAGRDATRVARQARLAIRARRVVRVDAALCSVGERAARAAEDGAVVVADLASAVAAEPHVAVAAIALPDRRIALREVTVGAAGLARRIALREAPRAVAPNDGAQRVGHDGGRSLAGHSVRCLRLAAVFLARMLDRRGRE